MSAHVGFDTELQQITITTFITIVELLISLYSSFIYGFIIVIAIVLFMGHVLSCWVVSYF